MTEAASLDALARSKGLDGHWHSVVHFPVKEIRDKLRKHGSHFVLHDKRCTVFESQEAMRKWMETYGTN
jgi:hypothetical protein